MYISLNLFQSLERDSKSDIKIEEDTNFEIRNKTENEVKNEIKIEETYCFQERSIISRVYQNSYYDPAMNPMRSFNIHFLDSDS